MQTFLTETCKGVYKLSNDDIFGEMLLSMDVGQNLPNSVIHPWIWNQLHRDLQRRHLSPFKHTLKSKSLN